MTDRPFYNCVSKGVERKPQHKYFGLQSNVLHQPDVNTATVLRIWEVLDDGFL
jgi:hypothetical protein